MAQASVSAPTGRGGGRDITADNLLPYADQALFLGLRHGHEAVIQVFWSYRHQIDIDGLTRFRHNLDRGLLARLIEPSPLPFGRHRWVSSPTFPAAGSLSGPADRLRDPAEFYDWADDQISLPLDPQRGPGWRLAAQPFSDGSTAVSLVVSHCIADGGAVVSALSDAVAGVTRDLGYPSARSRTTRQAVAADLRQVLRDGPGTIRAAGGAVQAAVRRARELSRPAPFRVPGAAGSRAPVRAPVPSATAFVDTETWDGLAAARCGNGLSLVAALAAIIAARLGRAPDGAVTLTIPLDRRQQTADNGGNDNGRNDNGGNVVSLATVRVDPGGLAADLTEIRTAIRTALRELRDHPDEMSQLSPLVPFLPGRAASRIADLAFGFSADLPVSVSNMGDMPPEITRADGTPADRFWFRGMDRNVTSSALERRCGLLTVMSGRVGGDVVVTVISHQPGAANTRSGVRDVLVSAMAELGLVAAEIA